MNYVIDVYSLQMVVLTDVRWFKSTSPHLNNILQQLNEQSSLVFDHIKKMSGSSPLHSASFVEVAQLAEQSSTPSLIRSVRIRYCSKFMTVYVGCNQRVFCYRPKQQICTICGVRYTSQLKYTTGHNTLVWSIRIFVDSTIQFVWSLVCDVLPDRYPSWVALVDHTHSESNKCVSVRLFNLADP